MIQEIICVFAKEVALIKSKESEQEHQSSLVITQNSF